MMVLIAHERDPQCREIIEEAQRIGYVVIEETSKRGRRSYFVNVLDHRGVWRDPSAVFTDSKSGTHAFE